MDATIRRDDSLLCGRLVALPSTNPITEFQQTTQDDPTLRRAISIDFPAMPDVIELVRTTDYAVNWSLPLPDGIHQYRGTKPLEIPISFKLHFNDKQYAKSGCLTVLQLAARLHATVLPISTFNRTVTVAANAASTQTPQGGGRVNDVKLESSSQTDNFQVQKMSGDPRGASLYPPVTCWLHLMWTGDQMPGISCIGYVRECSVKFMGPWLRGPNNSFNLPTLCEFSFTFVHRPGHGNAVGFTSSADFPPTITETPQVFADDVKNLLYNTRALVYSGQYQGFGSTQNPNAPPADETPQPVPSTVPTVLTPLG